MAKRYSLAWMVGLLSLIGYGCAHFPYLYFPSIIEFSAKGGTQVFITYGKPVEIYEFEKDANVPKQDSVVYSQNGDTLIRKYKWLTIKECYSNGSHTFVVEENPSRKSREIELAQPSVESSEYFVIKQKGK